MKPLFAGSREFRGEVGSYFERWSPAVLRLARRITRNEADAEEVRQEVFVKFQEHLPRLDRSGNLAGWIFRTATTVALKIRERRFRPLPGSDAAVTDPPAGDPREDLEADLSRIRGALEKLPEPPRRILLERFRDGRTPVQIARRLGLEAGSVRVQIFRALEILRSILRSMP